MPIKSEADRYLAAFRWGMPAPAVTDSTRRYFQDFMDRWNEEIREHGMLNTPEETCRSFAILLEEFPELKESCLGLKMQEYLKTKDFTVQGEILDKVMMLKER